MDSEESEGEEEMEKRANWVERLLELRSRWMDRQRGKGVVDEDDDDGGCDVDYGSDGEEEVEFNAELFARFLVRVPWSETKLFSKLAFLCNMAYVIPELKVFSSSFFLLPQFYHFMQCHHYNAKLMAKDSNFRSPL